jgi:hypothetical protein
VTYAADTFGRTLTTGWGSTTPGGAYALAGAASSFAVSGSAGSMTIPAPGASLGAILSSVSALSINAAVRVQTNTAPGGSGQYIYIVARRQANGSEYRGQLRIAAGGGVSVRVSRTTSTAETLLGTEAKIPGLAIGPNTYAWLRMTATGTNPTVIRVMAWMVGHVEPADWSSTVMDTTVSLQAAGAVGLRVHQSASAPNAPIRFTFDDFKVVSTSAP